LPQIDARVDRLLDVPPDGRERSTRLVRCTVEWQKHLSFASPPSIAIAFRLPWPRRSSCVVQGHYISQLESKVVFDFQKSNIYGNRNEKTTKTTIRPVSRLTTECNFFRKIRVRTHSYPIQLETVVCSLTRGIKNVSAKLFCIGLVNYSKT